MNEILFEWDAVKAESNLKKHKVSFHEGLTVFHEMNKNNISRIPKRSTMHCAILSHWLVKSLPEKKKPMIGY